MSKAQEIIEKVKSVQEADKLSLTDPAIKNVAREMEFNLVDTAENSEDHMVFDYGGKQVVLDRAAGGGVTFTVDGNVVHTAGSDFDLKDYRDWKTVIDQIKG